MTKKEKKAADKITAEEVANATKLSVEEVQVKLDDANVRIKELEDEITSRDVAKEEHIASHEHKKDKPVPEYPKEIPLHKLNKSSREAFAKRKKAESK